ncbi:MAG: hormogonium polysaccharide biosynthesis protein HpsA [Cyanobacteria bacterium P01_D01_bin.156]
MSSALRWLLLLSKTAKTSSAGFVLPTTVLLLLVVSLTMGALSFRSFSRVERTIAIREQKIVDSFAAPAIDRAKAKLEYLFTEDDRVASKRPPSSNDLFGALTSQTDKGAGIDPYTLPDETALDITGDNVLDPAWAFDSNGNTVIYSLLVAHENDDSSGTTVSLFDNDAKAKADVLVTRNAPINTAEANTNCPVSRLAGDGWQETAANLQKNFQVDVLTVTGNGTPNKTVSAAEYQQVRNSPKGNKFGAYFRYDLDISPGDPFRWNGSMHSESNIIAGRNLQAYLVSSPESCIFAPDSSEITISESDFNGDETIDYKGNLIAGVVRDNDFDIDGAVRFHTDVAVDAGKSPNANVTVTETNFDQTIDSVDEDDDSQNLDDTYADPVKIFTEDITEQLDDSTWDFEIPIGDANKNLLGDRVLNKEDTDLRPFLDDGFRADNRYGPKPRYNAARDLDGQLIGTSIPTTDTELVGFDKAAGEYGLDGYWERRSIAEGLRIIVGQRLELGNAFGWEEDSNLTDDDDKESLYPPYEIEELTRISDNKRLKGPSEARHQISLRDNLAAVQGMVVYHYSIDDGEVPYMCMASTVHPGTQASLANSRTFGTYASTGAKRIDFLTGNGTNGWEFDFQGKYADASAFAAAVQSGQPLGKALRNLAHFAGDPYGGAPSFTPVQGISTTAAGNSINPDDNFVHPYPYLSMWGDFSVLRRILFSTPNATTAAETDLVGSTVAYDALSPADKASLHSAACTLGMLASNLETLEAEYDSIRNDTTDVGGGETVIDKIASALSAVSGLPTESKDWIAGLPAGFAYLEEAENLARYLQVLRDRANGFEFASADTCVAADFPGLTNSADASSIINAFCSTTQPAYYPSLYYLFPLVAHNQDGAGTQASEYITEGGASDKYVFDSGTNVGVNDDVTYQVLDTTTPANLGGLALTPLTVGTFKQPTASGSDLVAPNVLDDVGNATPPSDTDVRASLTQSEIVDGSTVYELAFLDKAMLDGRQLINARVLDLDIGKLTSDTPSVFGTDTNGNAVTWIPEEEGLVYAAREDAVREDSIVRPRRETWANCKAFTSLVTGNCVMKIDPTQPNQVGTFDPPLNAGDSSVSPSVPANSISPKPVDMYPDPDRRPYGFRLFNGYNLNRSNDEQAAGISFITDNPAYIYGDFNLHQDKSDIKNPLTDTPNVIEEFVNGDGHNAELLGTQFASFTAAEEANAKKLFYSRKNINEDFASGAGDSWRPSEIFADAITILSTNFRDGWVEDAYVYDFGTAVGNPRVASSYLNYNRIHLEDTAKTVTADGIVLARDRLLREDNETTDQCGTANGGDCDLPILFNRNGIPKKWRNNPHSSGAPCLAGFRDYPNCHNDDFTDNFDDAGGNIDNIKVERYKDQVEPLANARVNALLVAGIVPMRQNQTYGGIQNFPRLLEEWEDKNLIISGGFFQLNFSTQATAPQDQDALEPGATPVSGVNRNLFYNAAKRIWGYDVAFQYTSVAPVAQRFVSVGRPRSEFYRELPLGDAYIQNLCNARDSGNTPVISCD